MKLGRYAHGLSAAGDKMTSLSRKSHDVRGPLEDLTFVETADRTTCDIKRMWFMLKASMNLL